MVPNHPRYQLRHTRVLSQNAAVLFGTADLSILHTFSQIVKPDLRRGGGRQSFYRALQAGGLGGVFV
jgi:hypothetical protein